MSREVQSGRTGPDGECAAVRLLILYRRLVTALVRLVGLYELVTGLLILGGGEARLGSPVYFTMRELWGPLGVPLHLVLGLAAVGGGLLTALPRYRPSQAGLIVVSVWHLYLAASFTVAITQQPTAGFQADTSAVVLAIITAGLYRLRQVDLLGWER